MRVLGGHEQLLQDLPLHWLLDNRDARKAGFHAFHAIARDEDKRNVARDKHIGDGVDEVAAEVDIDNACVDILMSTRFVKAISSASTVTVPDSIFDRSRMSLIRFNRSVPAP